MLNYSNSIKVMFYLSADVFYLIFVFLWSGAILKMCKFTGKFSSAEPLPGFRDLFGA